MNECMSIYGDKYNEYPNAVCYKCECGCNHRICEACFIYYDQERETETEEAKISKIIGMERAKSDVLVTKIYKQTDRKDYYYFYNPLVKRNEQRTPKMEGNEVIKAEFPTVVPLDQRFKFVIEAKVEMDQNQEP
jgi:hypothetical protein